MSKRKYGGGEKKGDEGGGKRWISQQKGQLSGPGILLTTVRRKERKAALELIAFLSDVADHLYPDLDLSMSNKTMTKAFEVDADDSLDAMRNGQSANIGSVEGTTELPVEAKRKRISEDDIEAQIQAELQELRPQKKSKEASSSVESSSRSKQRERFEIVDLDVECLAYITVASPMDPVKLCCEILDEVARTGQVRGRFVQRLSPIYMTGRAEISAIRQLSSDVVSEYYPNLSEASTVSDQSLR